MLAIIKALQEWDSELRSVAKFKIITDHKNLEYFMTVKRLSERQMRWSLILSRYNFQIAYRPGKNGGLPDALTRREQDLPSNTDDERLTERRMQLLKPEQCEDKVIPEKLIKTAMSKQNHDHETSTENQEEPLESNTPQTPIIDSNPSEDQGPIEKGFSSTPQESTDTQSENSLTNLWVVTQATDTVYQQLLTTLKDGARKFPASLGIKVSVADCSLDNNQLLFRGRRWVPDSEELRTRLIQTSHDSVLTGHPGRDGTIAILRRQYFWPGIDQSVRRFVHNCRPCGRNTVWRERRHGLLKPLPIPERIGQELSMDFIVGLPLSNGCSNIMVVID